MQQIIAALLSLLVSPSDGEALLRATPRTRISTSDATLHIAAARLAGAVTETDPDLLLAIAYRESRYDPTVMGPVLANGKRACGVMQHVPMESCPEPSLLRDYLAGAEHLKRWIHSQRGSVERGLAGYAGGYASLKRFDEDETSRVRTVVRLNMSRAALIKKLRTSRSGI